MSEQVETPAAVDREELRDAIREEYQAVADEPTRGFHFHTGRPLARILHYDEAWLAGIPETAIESFAGTGNPFSLGTIKPGEHVVDVGCGAGIDSFIAANMVGTNGQVIGIDMTDAMLSKAKRAAAEAGFTNVTFKQGYGEDLPVEDGWADVVISNGVLNLMHDKTKALREMYRILKIGGRLQLGDILIQRPVSEGGKKQIDLWTG
jgi:arsenite methyltransferase